MAEYLYKVTGVVREGHASGGSVPFSYPAGKAKKSSSYLVGRFSSRVCFARISRANWHTRFLDVKEKGYHFWDLVSSFARGPNSFLHELFFPR